MGDVSGGEERRIQSPGGVGLPVLANQREGRGGGLPSDRIDVHVDVGKNPVALVRGENGYRSAAEAAPWGLGRAVASTLIREEEERFVLLDGSAHGAAELVLMKLLRLGQEEVAGVQEGVAVKLKTITVERVRAGLGHRIHDSSAVPPVFGIDRVGDHVDFGDSVRAGDNQGIVQGEVVGIRSVDQEAVVLGTGAAGREVVGKVD